MSSTSPDQIEVEKKYAADDGVEVITERVLALGGAEQGSIQFTDTYFDTVNCELTAHDVWLRKRDAQWEIKVPIEGDEKRSGGERSVFREVEGPERCLLELKELLGVEETTGSVQSDDAYDSPHLLDEFMNRKNIAPFASFSTVRKKLTLDGAAVDIDAASFGHTVVEVEVLCKGVDEIDNATELVEATAKKLNLKDIGATGGKLETYIRNNCQKQLETLITKKILKP
jgi:thiamine-triphosphatase